jgi:hypothetical protein
MDAVASEDERELLDQLIDDGWPLAVLAPGGGDVQRIALSLLGKGLVTVYGGPAGAVVSPAEAKAILTSSES